ncbi:hypothetical protein OQI89_08950 [Lentilactobacillus diolivorans]|uniref:hypothetical protein n=1 Tax=Lentilactobacillus diolivorans TaxID=179838 RepID=UPI002469097A|nr:hypothetical protein [Lentilactobacillus diolivorans]MDH5105977.1 hypothetical protein [Lentilactobacillus diolivorans]
MGTSKTKKNKLLIGTFFVFIGVLFIFSIPKQAEASWNKAPGVLKGVWQSNYQNKSHLGHKHWYTILSISNTQISLRDFDYTGAGFSGEYGIHRGYWALGFQKASPRHYYIWGSANQYGSHSRLQRGYGILLTRNYKHLKLYDFKVINKNGHAYFSNRHYQAYFHHGWDNP